MKTRARFAPRQLAVLVLEQQVWGRPLLVLHLAVFAQPWEQTFCQLCSLILRQHSRRSDSAQRTVDERAGKGNSWFGRLRLVSALGGRLSSVLGRHDGSMLPKARVHVSKVSWNFLVGSVAGAFDTPSRTTALVRVLAGHESSVEDTRPLPPHPRPHTTTTTFAPSRPPAHPTS
jgi:hypothetical protein